MMLIAQARMRVKAREPDCEQPYTPYEDPEITVDEEQKGEQITHSFFSDRFKSK